MVDNNGYELLEEKFGINRLDVQNRAFAGICGYGRIYCAKEHIAAIGQCMADNPSLKNRMSFLHFIYSDGKLIAFVDSLTLFPQTPIEEVVRVIFADQLHKVDEIYEYKYPNQIRRKHTIKD